MDLDEKTPDGVEFDALEYTADDTFAPTRLRFAPDAQGGWRIERNGRLHLELGQGYRFLRSRSCGVCATDLDRRFLPFPLPQVIGHEVVAEDEAGTRFVVEINASHAARGFETGCPFCSAGLGTHCPDRLVLGIHDLPGGFGPFILAPEHALVALPSTLSDSTAALVEPFAAALRAVTMLDPAPGTSVAVLGPGRLGLLVVAALAAHRRASGRAFEIVATGRRRDRLELAERLGADRSEILDREAPPATALADIVVDTTGSPGGLALACALATREVHLKSTHGQPALGLAHWTEAVVDELSIQAVDGPGLPTLATALSSVASLCAPDRLRVGWLSDAPPPNGGMPASIEWICAADPLELQERLDASDPADEQRGPTTTLSRVDAMILTSEAWLDAAIRPTPGQETSPVRPTGALFVRMNDESRSPTTPLGTALAGGLRISTSRCGDFRSAVDLLAHDVQLARLGNEMISHRFAASALPAAFERARSPEGLKVLVEHDGAKAGEPSWVELNPSESSGTRPGRMRR